MKKLVTGIKPTGRIHLGNYFGVFKNLLTLQNQYESQIFIANYHALTSVQDKEKLEESTFELMVALLAIGIDPKKVTLYKQSDVPEVQELAWILSSLATMPFMMRAHAFKDAEAKNKEINVATFNYPILMAADILITNADIVPVGKDQKQHVEIARDLAQKFNNAYGRTLKEPQELINKDTETVVGTDGQKMSKSYDNVIPLFATDSELEKIIMSIPTDSKGVDDPKDTKGNALFELHSLILDREGTESLKTKYETPGMGYKEAKEDFLRDLIAFVGPIREKRDYYLNNKRKVEKIYRKGGERIRKEAKNLLTQIKEDVGL